MTGKQSKRRHPQQWTRDDEELLESLIPEIGEDQEHFKTSGHSQPYEKAWNAAAGTIFSKTRKYWTGAALRQRWVVIRKRKEEEKLKAERAEALAKARDKALEGSFASALRTEAEGLSRDLRVDMNRQVRGYPDEPAILNAIAEAVRGLMAAVLVLQDAALATNRKLDLIINDLGVNLTTEGVLDSKEVTHEGAKGNAN